MPALIPRGQDFWAGIIFLCFGISAFVFGRRYNIGTAQQMGPGYFPMLLALILVTIGAILSLRNLATDKAQVEAGTVRPFLVLVAIVVFAILLEDGGFVLAAAAVVVIGALADPASRTREVLALAAGLVVASVALFSWGLGLQIPIWPRFLEWS